MRVISRRRLRELAGKHPQAKSSVESWYHVVHQASWKSFVDVRQVYRTTDFVEGRTVFNIAGNKYHLITSIDYQVQTVYIRDFLTHAEYDKARWKK